MKKLIIVCEEKLKHYGDFLSQLISRDDDTNDTTVGVKDGAVGALVWTEKEYLNNTAQLSSEQYILFIGNSKLQKEKRKHMQKVFSEYGMNYGWLGKQATLFVDRVVSLTEYDSFFQMAQTEYLKGKQTPFEKLVGTKETTPALPEAVADDAVIVKEDDISTVEQSLEKPEKGIMKLLDPLKTARVAVKKTADRGIESIGKVSEELNKATKNKNIEEQEYSCLILFFYLNGLSNFLGLSEG